MPELSSNAITYPRASTTPGSLLWNHLVEVISASLESCTVGVDRVLIVSRSKEEGEGERSLVVVV